jgi:hypothetical protein
VDTVRTFGDVEDSGDVHWWDFFLWWDWVRKLTTAVTGKY